MNPNTAQTLCQIGIAFFSVLMILCALGSFYFGKKIDTATKHENQIFKEKTISQQNEIIKYLKEFKLEGNKEIIDQIKKPEKWDFSIGSTTFWLSKKVFSDKKSSTLLIISEDKNASIKFLKKTDNKVQFIYSFPTIGKIVRETLITRDDIEENEIGVFFAFTWDLKKAETVLYINGKVRQ